MEYDPYYAGQGNPNWKKGVSGNPNGRPVHLADGKKVQKRLQEAFTSIAEFIVSVGATNFTNAVDILMAFANDKDTPSSLRISASAAAAPYQSPKKAAVPVPQYIPKPVTVPHPIPSSLEQINANIVFITTRKAAGEIDLATADSLITDQRAIAYNLISNEELKIKLLNSPNAVRDQTIRIEGGLPPLPGTNITMPQDAPRINGHMTPVIEAQASQAKDPEP